MLLNLLAPFSVGHFSGFQTVQIKDIRIPIPCENTSSYIHFSSLIPQSGLFKFVKVGAEQVTAPVFVSYLTFLRAISGTASAARNCYNLLRSDTSQVTSRHRLFSLQLFTTVKALSTVRSP